MAHNVIAEAKRCLNCKKPLCRQGCPINTPIPDFISAFLNGEMKKAGKMLFENNPLSAVCSIVCNHGNQCQGHCIRGLKGEPVEISTIENFISSAYLDSLELDKAEPNGIKVAVVGAGPAGITISIKMAQLGYDVTVFESKSEIGGVLRYGIPEFRLPNSIVDDEISALENAGVRFVRDCIIGKTLTRDDLLGLGFDGLFVASGAGLPRFMGIPGENLSGVMSSNEYLTRVNLMGAGLSGNDTPVVRGRRAVVVGGGNTAMDSVRTARRMGAKKAMIVYRRSEAEMPARIEEIAHAKEEGVEFLTLSNPVEYLGDDQGRVRAVRLQRMRLGEPDESGRRSPEPIPGAIDEIETDMVIVSVGVSPNPLIPNSVEGLQISRRGTIEVDPQTMESSVGNLFAGGDIVRGGATVILAMGDGRRAAAAMDAKLSAR